MIVLSEAEDCMIVCSFVWTKHRNVTDGQTDRQTDYILWLLQQSVDQRGRAVTNADQVKEPV